MFYVCSFKGIVLAVCCHHRCNWESYVGKDFFLDSGFSAEDFHLIITLSSWYTCGAKVVSEEDGKLSAEERSAIGKRCKFLIDYGRQKYLESYNMETEIVTFTDQNVSLENILIKARKFWYLLLLRKKDRDRKYINEQKKNWIIDV